MAWKRGVAYVVSTFESDFSNAATLNIAVGFGEVSGTSLGGSLGRSQQTYVDSTFAYSAVRR